MHKNDYRVSFQSRHSMIVPYNSILCISKPALRCCFQVGILHLQKWSRDCGLLAPKSMVAGLFDCMMNGVKPPARMQMAKCHDADNVLPAMHFLHGGLKSEVYMDSSSEALNQCLVAENIFMVLHTMHA